MMRTKKAPRREYRFAENYDPGSIIEWKSIPFVRDGSSRVMAPSKSATVSWVAGGVAFARFHDFDGDRTSEPLEVVPGQSCEEVMPW